MILLVVYLSLSRSHTNKQVLTHTCRHNCIHFRGFVSLTLPLSLYILCITLSLSKQKISRNSDIMSFKAWSTYFISLLSLDLSLSPFLSFYSLILCTSCLYLILCLTHSHTEDIFEHIVITLGQKNVYFASSQTF